MNEKDESRVAKLCRLMSDHKCELDRDEVERRTQAVTKVGGLECTNYWSYLPTPRESVGEIKGAVRISLDTYGKSPATLDVVPQPNLFTAAAEAERLLQERGMQPIIKYYDDLIARVRAALGVSDAAALAHDGAGNIELAAELIDDPNAKTAWFYLTSTHYDWEGPCETRDVALSKGCELAEHYGDTCVYLCQAKYSPLDDDIFDGDSLLTRWQEINDSGLLAPAIIENLTDEAVTELENKLRDAFTAWRAKHQIGDKSDFTMGRMLHQEKVPIIRFPKEHELGGL